MLNIPFFSFVNETFWTDTFVTNKDNLSPEQQDDVRRDILANITSPRAIEELIGGDGKLDYATSLGQTTFPTDLKDTATRIWDRVNGTAAGVAAKQLVDYAANFSLAIAAAGVGEVISQCDKLLDSKRMESLELIAPAAAEWSFSAPTLLDESLKEVLHNVTDRVWMYCFEVKNTPICQEQLVTWFRGNPDIAGVGMLTVFYIQVCIAIVVCKFPLLIYIDKWFKWLLHSSYSYDDIMRPAAHRIDSDLSSSSSGSSSNNDRVSLKAFFHRMLSRDHHYAAVGQFLDNYFDTAAMFLISVLVAGWMMIEAGSFTEYELDTLLYGISLIFSSFVPAIAAGVYYKPSRRYFKLFTGLLTTCFYIATVLYVRLKNITAELNSLCAPLMAQYPQRPVPLENFQDAWAIYIVAGTTTLIALLLIITQLVLRHHDSQSPSTKRKARGIASPRFRKPKLLLLFFSMLLCDFCSILSLYHLMTRRSRAKSVAGTEYEDDQWSFGQILALFIWAPAVVDYSYVLGIGAKKAFEGKVPGGYEVVVKRERRREREGDDGEEGREEEGEREGEEKGGVVEVVRSNSGKV